MGITPSQIAQVDQNRSHKFLPERGYAPETIQQLLFSNTPHEFNGLRLFQRGEGENHVRLKLGKNATHTEHNTGAELGIPEKAGNQLIVYVNLLLKNYPSLVCHFFLNFSVGIFQLGEIGNSHMYQARLGFMDLTGKQSLEDDGIA